MMKSININPRYDLELENTKYRPIPDAVKEVTEMLSNFAQKHFPDGLSLSLFGPYYFSNKKTEVNRSVFFKLGNHDFFRKCRSRIVSFIK